jgi:cell division protein FtsW
MRPRHSVTSRRQPQYLQPQLQLGRKHKPDYWLLIWCATLLAIGLIVVYAISPALAITNNVSSDYYVDKQIIAIALSGVAFAITAKVPLKTWRRAYKPLLAFAGLATLLALALPVNPLYPAHRWVRLGSFSFQSVELVKFAGMIWVAGFLAERIQSGSIRSIGQTFRPLLLALLALGVIVAGVQSDLGSTGVLVIMVGTMACVAGLPMGRVVLIGGVVLLGLVLAISSTPYRRARLETFLHPDSNCQGSGYQACQSLISVGSGGVMGLGLGNSVQAYGYEPEAANDSIFAIYAEKFGFVGTMVLLLIFGFFFTRLKSVAERLPDDFSRLLVIGVLAWFSTQALINIGGMIGLLPLKGITLPFISYGGTSVVFSAAAVGLVFQASQYTTYGSPRKTTPDDSAGQGRDFRNNTLRRAND